MKAIGGYFELELNNFGEYHKKAIHLNTGRNALEYVLRCHKFKKIYIPYYTCDVLIEPFKKLNIKYEFYNVNDNFEPLLSNIGRNAAILYTNYFGICEKSVNTVVKKFTNVVIDNCQAFFSRPNKHALASFYSCRKFFGVPDGAYLYMNKKLNVDFEVDISELRLAHLIKRIEYGPEKGYTFFKKNENMLKNQIIKQMSLLTKMLLSNIDYDNVKSKRRKNFLYLHEHLSKYNELSFDYKDNMVPMVYPFLVSFGSVLKKRLISNKVYVATYWPNVKNWVKKDSFEYYLAENLVPLPIDQRYNFPEIKRILKILQKLL